MTYTVGDVDRLIAGRTCTACGDTGLIPCQRWDGSEFAAPCDQCVAGGVMDARLFGAELSYTCPECLGDGEQSCGPDSHEDCEWCQGLGDVTENVHRLWNEWKESADV